MDFKFDTSVKNAEDNRLLRLIKIETVYLVKDVYDTLPYQLLLSEGYYERHLFSKDFSKWYIKHLNENLELIEDRNLISYLEHLLKQSYAG